MDYLVFLVKPKGTNLRVFVYARGRETAKHAAARWLGGEHAWGGFDNWEVTPLTEHGDRVFLDVTFGI